MARWTRYDDNYDDDDDDADDDDYDNDHGEQFVHEFFLCRPDKFDI